LSLPSDSLMRLVSAAYEIRMQLSVMQRDGLIYYVTGGEERRDVVRKKSKKNDNRVLGGLYRALTYQLQKHPPKQGQLVALSEVLGITHLHRQLSAAM